MGKKGLSKQDLMELISTGKNAIKFMKRAKRKNVLNTKKSLRNIKLNAKENNKFDRDIKSILKDLRLQNKKLKKKRMGR